MPQEIKPTFFSGILSYFQFGICPCIKSLGEGNTKDIEKLFSSPQSGSSQRDKSIESRLHSEIQEEQTDTMLGLDCHERNCKIQL